MAEDFSKLIKSARRRPLFTPGETTTEIQLERSDVERLLPHRDPFLFVDRISAIDLDQETMRGHRRIAEDDPVFKGHFPEYAVYPGALLVETMGQLTLCLHYMLDKGRTHVTEQDKPSKLRMLKLHHALFQAEVRPGDEIEILGKRVMHDSFTVICAGQVLKQGQICAMSIMEVYLVDDDDA